MSALSGFVFDLPERPAVCVCCRAVMSPGCESVVHGMCADCVSDARAEIASLSSPAPTMEARG